MAMNDLLSALGAFQNGMTQLSTGRAIRGAADQAQAINMNEQDEFKKRQQLTQLGTGLAAQLSSYGANPGQIQSSVGALMPQQLNNPNDFFAASQTATNPQAKQQLAKAGQSMQAQFAAAPLTTAQQEQFRLERYKLLNEREALKGARVPAKLIDVMNEEDKQLVTVIGKDNATKLNISNSMKAFLDEFDKKKTQDDKIAFARMAMPKIINSVAGGLDAVGESEYDRIMNLLEFAPLGNTFSGSPMRVPGRDVDGFRKEVGSVLNGMQSTLEQNYKSLNENVYQKYGESIPIPKFVQLPAAERRAQQDIQQADKDISAITQKINSNQVNDAERLQAMDLLQRLKTKKENAIKLSGK